MQLLLAAGVPSPACQLLSNHYNLTRKEYLRQLRYASESGGDVLPFITYALQGFLEGLRGQLIYIRKLHIDTSWVNFVHEYFRQQHTKAAQRQKSLLLDLSDQEDLVPIAELDQLSPRLAKAYHGLHPRTCTRDVEALTACQLLVKRGKAVRANRELMATFLPIRAGRNPLTHA